MTRRHTEGATKPVKFAAIIADNEDILGQAKALAGEEWGTIRTWPLESGLIWLAEKLKG